MGLRRASWCHTTTLALTRTCRFPNRPCCTHRPRCNATHSPEHAESVAALQRLMLALTRLQRVEDRGAFEALEQVGGRWGCGGRAAADFFVTVDVMCACL